MKVAIVHDWLVTYSGAERVLEQILCCFPDADLFSVIDFIPDNNRDFLLGKRATTTWVQKFPFARTRYRAYLPFMTFAIEQLDMSKYDLVISSSYAVAKGVITGPDQIHICLCHSPMRYAWDLQHQYLAESGLSRGIRSFLARWMLHKIRLWDFRSASSVDEFIAISRFVQRRIEVTYRRSSQVIYPPVDVDAFALSKEKSDFYVTVSRMVPYKRIDLIVQAFSRTPQRRLVVIGEGPQYQSIKRGAGANVQFLGRQPFNVMRQKLQEARAFVFAAEEDFGIAPLEAQACGTPVIAYAKGGALETIVGSNSDGEQTGVFFYHQTPESIIAAIDQFEAEESRISPEACRANAMRFNAGRFRDQFQAFVKQTLGRYYSSQRFLV